MYIDDVYSGGSGEEAEKLNLPLLSTAIQGGLFHPNCKHHLSTYFPDDEDKAQKGKQEHHYLQNKIQRERRLIAGSLDENKIQEHANKEQKLIGLDEKWLKESEKYENAIKEVRKDDIISNTWRPVIDSQYEKAIDLIELNLNGIKYIVDGKNVVLDYSVYEKRIGDILAKKYGKDVKMVPRINYPQGISTADYLIDGERYDLKTPKGSGKNLLSSMITKKKKQSDNFIFDISNCPLSQEEIFRQITRIYGSNKTLTVKNIVVLKHGEIIKAFRR